MTSTVAETIRPTYRFAQAFFMVFYSPRLYLDVVKKWRGFGLKYLLFMMALVVIPQTVNTVQGLMNAINERLIDPMKKIPTLYVQNGQLMVDKSMPYRITNSRGELVGLIDTRERYQTMDIVRYPSLMFFFTKDTFFFHTPAPESSWKNISIDSSIHQIHLDPKQNEVIRCDDFFQRALLWRFIVPCSVLIYGMTTMLYFSLYLTVILVVAMMGKIFSRAIFNIKLSYKEATRLLMVVSTVQAVVFFGSIGLGMESLNVRVGSLFLVIIYYSYALLSVKRDRRSLILRQ